MSQPSAAMIVAAESLAEIWGDDMLLADLATRLTCNESDAMADFLTQWGEEDAADLLREWHAEGDEEGDLHFSNEEED